MPVHQRHRIQDKVVVIMIRVAVSRYHNFIFISPESFSESDANFMSDLGSHFTFFEGLISVVTDAACVSINC